MTKFFQQVRNQDCKLLFGGFCYSPDKRMNFFVPCLIGLKGSVSSSTLVQ